MHKTTTASQEIANEIWRFE